MNFEEIIKGFKKDGTHSDYPIQKVYDWGKLSEIKGLTFDLPALVVYEPNEKGEIDQIGIVFAISNTINGLYIKVKSEYNGKEYYHLINESPSGKQPAYLLMKKHFLPKGAL